MSDAPYRWNKTEAAVAYDAGAPVIHPHYTAVQDAILAALPFAREQAFRVVDIGGGSGRLIQRILEVFPAASGVVMDQSEPFLALARDRLAPFDGRAACRHRRLQDDWRGELAPVDAIVSTSAIHHLEPAEKRALFVECRAALAPGGVFINGDEYRPAADADHRALLDQWRRHMESSLAAGAIPASFGPVIDAWTKRNITDYGSPRKSGDDCLETIDAQLGALREVGFTVIDVAWQKALWAVLVARK